MTQSADFRHAFLINLLSSGSGTLLRFIVFALLARLLGPHELGVYAIAAVIVGIAQVLRDLGVGAWLQREADLTPQKVSGALGLLCCSGALIALLLALGGRWLARALGQPELGGLIPVMALSLALMPFNTVIASLLQRNLEAARLAAVARTGSAAHGLTVLSLAWAGCGAMSLAWAQLANVLACGAACWLLRPPRWQWRPAFAGWHDMLRFGRGSLAANLLQVVNNALPELLLGRLGSAQQVGLLGRANATVHLLDAVAGSAIGFGSLKLFAEAQRGQALVPRLSHAIALLTGLAWPLLAMTVLLGESIVLLLFGPRWLDCVPALAALAGVAALGVTFTFSALALAAVKRPGLAALPVLASALARIALALCFFDGGVAGFADVLLGAALLAMPVQLFVQSRYLGCTMAALLGAVWRSAVVTLVCAGVVLVLQHLLPALTPAAGTLALAASLALAAWYGVLHLLGHPLADELQRLQLSPRFLITIRK